MDVYILDLLVIGLLLLFVTLGSGWIKRLPLSYALIYLTVGIALSPYGLNLIQTRPDANFLERVAEMAVLISLFTCGLKMNRPLQVWAWNSTARLIGLLMPFTIIAIALISHYFLQLSWGAAVLLGAILAPTDPVLASEVQLTDPDDRDELRFGLTSEGGLNDALAFPFVYFGLRWLDNDRWQEWLTQWVLVDVFWAIGAGLVMGILVARTIVWIDRRIQRVRSTDVLMEDFVVLGMILITYSLTEIVNGYGFLAVFVAGVVAQRSYRNSEKRASQLEFAETIEKLMEVGVILLLGSLLRIEPILKYWLPGLLIAGSLIFIIRPVGAWISSTGEHYSTTRRLLFGWFGIRGVGSLYYLFYALGKGLNNETGELIAWVTLMTVVISVVLHGISTTPIMSWYEKQLKRHQQKFEQALRQGTLSPEDYRL